MISLDFVAELEGLFADIPDESGLIPLFIVPALVYLLKSKGGKK